MKKDSPFVFISGLIITLALSFLIYVILFRTVDMNTWVGLAIGWTLLWLNAWVISRRKKKWPYKVETSQQQKKQ